MQIPLDYYRILGIPIQAESSLIQQAYEDGIQQLPHHSYTECAIASRKKLVTKAYQVLIDPQSRLDYESSFFQNQQETATGEVYREVTINIPHDLLLGALIILLNLGEYELVLRLATPYLKDKNLAQSELIDSDSAGEEFTKLWQDLVLTFVLANLELAREEWHEHQYDSAANSLQESYQLLIEEELFNNIKKEIKQDLAKLRPYQVLELFTKHQDNIQQRNKGIKLLKEMLDSRGGIENPHVDEFGLNVDGFLRFIQQIRGYLTSLEQQELFEEEAQRPSASAAYLAASAYLARGVTEKQPDLIVKAKNHLISLTLQQDIHLEQSICALLLAQTAEAEFSLAQSREENVIKYIKEISQDSPDLLPGLCLYTEKWLQTEIFPQFQDLKNKTSSLDEYFANSEVQEYLDNLSTPLNWDDNRADFVELDIPQFEVNSSSLNPEIEETENYPAKLVHEDDEIPDLLSFHSEIDIDIPDESELATESPSEELDEFALPSLTSEIAEDLSLNNQDNIDSVEQYADVSIPPENIVPEKTPLTQISPTKQVSRNIRPRRSRKQVNNIAIPIVIALIAFGALGAIAFTIKYLWTKLTQNNEQLEISLSESLIEVPTTKPEPPVNPPDNNPPNNLDEQLDKQKALSIINKWLDAKKQATGPNYNLAALNQILTNPQLSFWLENSKELRTQNAHRRYEHQVKILSAEINPQNTSEGKIEAQVQEKSQYYVNGALRNKSSYEDDLTVEYQLLKQGNQWLIRDIKILKNNR